MKYLNSSPIFAKKRRDNAVGMLRDLSLATGGLPGEDFLSSLGITVEQFRWALQEAVMVGAKELYLSGKLSEEEKALVLLMDNGFYPYPDLESTASESRKQDEAISG